jgi:hypothetical protein
VVTYLRRAGSEEFLVAVNLSNTPFNGTLEAPAGNWKEIELPIATAGTAGLPALSLASFGMRIFERQKQ